MSVSECRDCPRSVKPRRSALDKFWTRSLGREKHNPPCRFVGIGLAIFSLTWLMPITKTPAQSSGRVAVLMNWLVLPEVPKAFGRKLCVSDGVRNVPVPEVVLYAASVSAVLGELIASSMTQHVRVNRKGKSCDCARSGNHLADGGIS